jgi:hydroxymethylbilane synthase
MSRERSESTRSPASLAAGRREIVIGSRGSKLALWQSNYIKDKLEALTGLPVEIKVIKTTGDKILDVPLAKVGGKGLFTKEIEVELSAGTVDLAVHSMKDVPTELPDGLVIAAMPPRVDPRDAIVSGKGYALDTLPFGAKVGTSSLRRCAQLRALRPDVCIVDVRGNLDTRMRKAEEGELDAVILAAAGITRMGWADRITHYVEPEQMVSAVGQGAIGIEIRADDAFMVEVCAKIADPETMACVTAERVVMRTLEGGCQVPIGARANIHGETMHMEAVVGSIDGTTIVRYGLDGLASEPEALGAAMVDRLLDLGAGEVLADVRAAAEADVGVDKLIET